MHEIVSSRELALRTQGWLFGERLHRIGHPFEWLDGEVDYPALSAMSGIGGVLQNLSMFFDTFGPTPAAVAADDEPEVREKIAATLARMVRFFVPFAADRFGRYIHAHSVVRAQDYAFLERHCGLPKCPSLLDVGPGLGSAAIYAEHMGGQYIALETAPNLYDVQRLVFRFLSTEPVLDLITAEHFGADLPVVASDIGKLQITHLPSWHAGLLPPNSVDAAICCWVLNEASTPAVFWLISHLTRIIKDGGCVYIRDGKRLRPGMHDYDVILEQIGFKCIAAPEIRNRVDMQGIPRAYRLIERKAMTFDQMCETFLGNLEAPVHARYGRR